MELHGNRRDVLIGAAAICCGFIAPAARARAHTFSPTRFSVEVTGAGPDVILIPGLGSSRQVWRPAVAAVPGYRYHLMQVAGFAGEPVRGNRSGRILPGLAEELAAYASGLRRPAVVGHSMGAALGLMLAIRQPGHLSRLMVVDMLPQPSAMLGSTPHRLGPLANNLRGLTRAPGGRALLSSIVDLFAVPGEASSRSDPDVMARAMHELAELDLGEDLARLNVPTTIVYASPGAAQGAAVDRVFASAYRALREASFVRIDDSSHQIMADRPAQFREALRAFLSGAGLSRGG